MKYVVIYVFDGTANDLLSSLNNPYGLMPGSIYEVDRADNLEEANKKAKAFKPVGGHLMILPYYDVE